jgi:hypothetical protein
MSTAPKPFVFVLMPFDAAFNDTYRFGIKDAAADVGAYAERLDEQIFSEGMLDRIFNQISKADVIVADMTGRTPNVFYEVGYAHALNKVVLLLTKDAADIPFDLKHRQHIVYGGSIEQLRKDLVERLHWAIAEAERAKTARTLPSFSLRVQATAIPQLESGLGHYNPPTVGGMITDESFSVDVVLRNEAPEESCAISHVYLFGEENGRIVPRQRPETYSGITLTYVEDGATALQSFGALPSDCADGLKLQYRLPMNFPSMPPGAVEQRFMYCRTSSDALGEFEAKFRLRLHCGASFYDYPFTLSVVRGEKPKQRIGHFVMR